MHITRPHSRLTTDRQTDNVMSDTYAGDTLPTFVADFCRRHLSPTKVVKIKSTLGNCLFCAPQPQCRMPMLRRYIFYAPRKSSPRSWLLKECASVLVPTITDIVNLSLTSGQFHPILKESVISPLLKKSNLDKDQLSNYRPISNLSLISKIIERIVKSRLTDHLTSNRLLNPHQSAYCKHHSTEIALLYICDHLINAIGSQKLSCLCLLDLSAAFDTIDHSISYSPATHLGSAFMALSSTGLSRRPTCHLAPSCQM